MSKACDHFIQAWWCVNAGGLPWQPCSRRPQAGPQQHCHWRLWVLLRVETITDGEIHIQGGCDGLPWALRSTLVACPTNWFGVVVWDFGNSHLALLAGFSPDGKSSCPSTCTYPHWLIHQLVCIFWYHGRFLVEFMVLGVLWLIHMGRASCPYMYAVFIRLMSGWANHPCLHTHIRTRVRKQWLHPWIAGRSNHQKCRLSTKMLHSFPAIPYTVALMPKPTWILEVCIVSLNTIREYKKCSVCYHCGKPWDPVVATLSVLCWTS